MKNSESFESSEFGFLLITHFLMRLHRPGGSARILITTFKMEGHMTFHLFP
jgi:hypothetical protein